MKIEAFYIFFLCLTLGASETEPCPFALEGNHFSTDDSIKQFEQLQSQSKLADQAKKKCYTGCCKKTKQFCNCCLGCCLPETECCAFFALFYLLTSRCCCK